MAQIKPLVIVELDPLRPVPEALAAIGALLPYNQDHKLAILEGIRDALDVELAKMNGEDTGAEQVRKP